MTAPEADPVGVASAGSRLSSVVRGALVRLAEARRQLAAIFREPEVAVREYLRRSHENSALALFLRLHLPLLTIYPVAALLCPAIHFGPGRFSFALQVVAPLVLVLGALLFAVIFDQVARFSLHPQLEEDPQAARPRNIALYVHLPLSAAGIFFILHPLLGFLMIFVALLYCLWLALQMTAIFYEQSRARVLVHMVNAALLGLVPLVVLALLGNLLRNITILKNL